MGSTAPSNNKPSSVYSRTGLLTSTGLHLNGSYVLHGLDMTWGNAIVPGKTRSLYGKHVLHYLGEFDNIGQLVSNLGTGTECKGDADKILDF